MLLYLPSAVSKGLCKYQLSRPLHFSIAVYPFSFLSFRCYSNKRTRLFYGLVYLLKREKGNITLYHGCRGCRGNLCFRAVSGAMLTGTNRLTMIGKLSSLAALLGFQGAFPILYGVRAARFGVCCFPFVALHYHTVYTVSTAFCDISLKTRYFVRLA